jgi:lipopolysaccharide biosynthesis protein
VMFPKILKDIFWGMPFISSNQKEWIYYNIKKIIRSEGGSMEDINLDILDKYRKQILSIPTDIDEEYHKDLTNKPYKKMDIDPKLIAFYLTQYHPTPDNDKWWGRGVTEWNNVSRAVPQFIGHYQPRLPGELGFYDLRLKDNIIRQIELAQSYGIYAFCFYYYWFDGKRLLEKPLNIFVDSVDIKFPFCLCWANESWTKGFFGSSREIIMEQNPSVDSYKKFIHDVGKYLRCDNYLKVKGKKLLLIYKPQDIPECKSVLSYWRQYCVEKGLGDLYLVGCWKSNQKKDFLKMGFDATAEFQAGAIEDYCKKINDKIKFVNEEYFGAIYSYKDIVKDKIYKKNFNMNKLYSAVMPMWDNTPRKNNKGSMIFDGSTPVLYKEWLKDIIENNKRRRDLDDNLIFINAWNEWGEGAYLEPDRKYGYAYLQATKEAIEESRG